MDKMIPARENPGEYRDLWINKEPFVEIEDGAPISVKMQYPLLGMKHAENRCFLRKAVYEKLLLAQQMLPEGLQIRVWDAWRPFMLQKELYDKYAAYIIQSFGLEKQSREEQRDMIKKFVSEPHFNKFFPPVHTTGGAIDVTLTDSTGAELNMGTAFDDFSDAAHTRYYEMHNNLEVRHNRRMLYHVMEQAGFTNFPTEWWHYDYGDRFWAFYNQKPALYEGVFEAVFEAEGV